MNLITSYARAHLKTRRRFQNYVASKRKQVMPKALSDDLHWRIIWQHLFREESAKQVAQNLYVSVKTVKIYMTCLFVLEEYLLQSIDMDHVES